MPTFTNPLDLYDHQKAAFASTIRTAKQAYRQIGEGTFKDYRELTSGGLSSATLRSMGHPYARSGNIARGQSKDYLSRKGLTTPKGVAPLLPINRQSGRLQRSIRIVHRSSRYAAEDSVFFDPQIAGNSLWAISPAGTRYVVARGLQVEASKRARIRVRAFRDVFYQGQEAAFNSPVPSTRGFAVLPT